MDVGAAPDRGDLDQDKQDNEDRPRLRRRRRTAFTPSNTRIDPLWRKIRAGDRVRVGVPGGEQPTGTIDALTRSLDAVWLLQDALGRRMLHPADRLTLERLNEES